MEVAIEKKPAGLENKSEQSKSGANEKQSGSDKQKKASIKTINPATNEVVKSFEEMTEQEIESAISGADKAYQGWKKTSYDERANLLHKVASLMRKEKDTLAKLITLEMGKLLKESEGEIDLSANIIDYYADNGAKFLADQTLKTEHGEAIVRHSPVGVLLGIEPWNFPFYQVARFAAPNIMIGNVVLVKHASNVPQCGIAIEKLFKEAGAPAGVYTNLLIPGSKATVLL
jgi:succinate-semialdehyde dehydrogenase/glutarate-semialdehyde dehydrogenase